MKVEYKARNIELTDSFKKLVEKKVKRLERYLKDKENVKLELYMDRQRGIDSIKALLFIDGQVMIVKDDAPDIVDALNSVIDVLEEKLMRRKDKYVTITRNQPRLPEKFLEELEKREMMEIETSTERKQREVVRKKQIVEALTERQALNLIEESKSPVLVFYNRDTDNLSVLYRDEDRYVLFEPIM